jgi:23S rRNA U2552 (ribose-2'-O)-methylase RlmE/FtsJ
VSSVVDLCAAPGGWTEVLMQLCRKDEAAVRNDPTTNDAVDAKSTLLEAKQTLSVIAVDLAPMTPIKDVLIMQGDITRTQTAQAIIKAAGTVVIFIQIFVIVIGIGVVINIFDIITASKVDHLFTLIMSCLAATPSISIDVVFVRLTMPSSFVNCFFVCLNIEY